MHNAGGVCTKLWQKIRWAETNGHCGWKAQNKVTGFLLILGCRKMSHAWQVASPAWPWWVCDMHTNTCTAVPHWQPTGCQHQEPFGLVGYLLQEKLESLLLDRQSKTKSILMERKEEIDVQGSFPGINLQQGYSHFFPLKIAHRSIAWQCYSSCKIQKKILKLWCFSKDCLGQAEVKQEEKVKQVGAGKSHNMSPWFKAWQPL